MIDWRGDASRDLREGGPTRCMVLPGYLPIADEFAAATGLSVDDASRIVDTNIVRGED